MNKELSPTDNNFEDNHEHYTEIDRQLADKLTQDTLGNQTIESVFAKYGMKKGEHVHLAYYGEVEVVAVDAEAQGVVVKDLHESAKGLSAQDFLYLGFLGAIDH